MRELKLRQTAVDVLAIAQAGAIAGIGLRGRVARDAMRHAEAREAQRREDKRWGAIVRNARESTYARVTERDYCDVIEAQGVALECGSAGGPASIDNRNTSEGDE